MALHLKNKEPNSQMKKLLPALTLAALSATSPALAWHTINCYNRTDPDLVVGVEFTAAGTSPVGYILNVPQGGVRVFGPLPEVGPCLRWLTVKVSNPSFNPPEASMTAPTAMNVCTEGYIIVSGTWPNDHGLGAKPLVITHGLGPGPGGVGGGAP